jgi:molecular chaperone DnaK (HSP70)
LGTSGDTHLGGEDFDRRVTDYLIDSFKRKTGKDISKDVRAVQKLRREVEKAKRTLSSVEVVQVEVDSLIDGIDFSEQLTRSKFEHLIIDMLKSTLVTVAAVLADANMRKDDIHEYILVGGSTRIPRVQQMMVAFFDGKQPTKGIHPDEAVAYGAAVLAAALTDSRFSRIWVCRSDSLFPPKQTRAVPIYRCLVAVKAHMNTINPPEINMVLNDITPLTLGIETEGGVLSPLIKRHTIVPTEKSQTYSTARDNQDTVPIIVYEGERTEAKLNNLLGSFTLKNIPLAPRGVPNIKVILQLLSNALFIPQIVFAGLF